MSRRGLRFVVVVALAECALIVYGPLVVPR